MVSLFGLGSKPAKFHVQTPSALSASLQASMNVYVFGLSHNTAPLSTVAKLTIGREKRPRLSAQLRQALGIEELIWLSTCNRFEIYFTKKEEGAGGGQRNPQIENTLRKLNGWLARCTGHEPDMPSRSCYLYSNQEAITHLMRLSSGLDSMILGESQILGQVKSAFQQAQKNGQTGTYLSKTFAHALMVGKHVRTHTKLGRQPNSYASMAVKLALRFYRNPERKKVLMIGTGEMIERMIKHFLKKGISRITIAGRSPDKAARLAGGAKLNSVPLEQISAVLPMQDLVISCTGSENLILSLAAIKKSMRLRKNRLVCMIDLALPPDLDPDAKEVEGVYLYDLEHFSSLLEKKKSSQTQDVREAEAIVRTQAASYAAWINSRRFVKLIQAIQMHAGRVQSQTLDEISSKAKNKNWKQDFALHELARELTKKLTLPVVERINKAAGEECNYEVLRAAERLYGMDAQSRPPETGMAEDEKTEEKALHRQKDESPSFVHQAEERTAQSDGEPSAAKPDSEAGKHE